jgi:DNA uptake protein ComE-like DNA-binding protein
VLTEVQVSNSTVYKSVIRNFTTSPSRREDFSVGIGYDAPISHAQAVAQRVLRDHPAVLGDPEPWVLVDSLGSATVNLRIYFWLDGSQHSWLKVRSSAGKRVGLTRCDRSGCATQERGTEMACDLFSLQEEVMTPPCRATPTSRDLNSATVEELRLVAGIDGARARYLVERRQRAGGFRSWEEVRQVPSSESGMVERLQESGFTLDEPAMTPR